MLHLDHWNAHDDSRFQSHSTPTDDHSSPLSPVPDNPPPEISTHMPTLQHLNPHMALAEEKEAPLEIPQREEEEEDDNALPPFHNRSSSRQSTPVSEVSPSPDDDNSDSTPPALNGHDSSSGDTRITEISSISSKTPPTAPRSSTNGTNPSLDPSVNGDAYPTPPPQSSWYGSPTHDPFSSSPQDPRTAAVLELNVDLLRSVFLYFLSHSHSITLQNLHIPPK